MKLLEVCVDSLASARAAKQGGADRLEFCSALAVGGLTPYADLLRQIKAELDLPVRCLMRPRAGDFLYTRDELELLCRQIETLRSAGADGFVIGALTPEGALDLPAMRTLLDACGGAPVTLHRCIDVSRDLCATYRAAAALGIDTVLTSGGAGSCRKGISQLAALLRLRDELDGPEVLIGAGVNAAVIDELRAALPGARAFHASCKTLLESGMTFRREGVPMGLPGLDEWHIQQTDADAVRAAKIALDRGLAGPVLAPSSYFMKSPAVQHEDTEARQLVEAFIKGDVEANEEELNADVAAAKAAGKDVWKA